MNNAYVNRSKSYSSKRRKLRVGPCIVLVIIFIMLGMLLNFVFSDSAVATDADPVIMNKVVVSKGDTLWSIVQEHYPEYDDIREAIKIVKEINNCNASINPGDILMIPAAV